MNWTELNWTIVILPYIQVEIFSPCIGSMMLPPLQARVFARLARWQLERNGKSCARSTKYWYSHNLKLKCIIFESHCKPWGKREKNTNLSNFINFITWLLIRESFLNELRKSAKVLWMSKILSVFTLEPQVRLKFNKLQVWLVSICLQTQTNDPRHRLVKYELRA